MALRPRHLHLVSILLYGRIFVYTFCLINIFLSLSGDANKIKTLSITVSVISENLSPIHRMVSEKFSSKNSKFYREFMADITLTSREGVFNLCTCLQTSLPVMLSHTVFLPQNFHFSWPSSPSTRNPRPRTSLRTIHQVYHQMSALLQALTDVLTDQLFSSDQLTATSSFQTMAN